MSGQGFWHRVDGPLGRGVALLLVAGCAYLGYRIHDGAIESARSGAAPPAISTSSGCLDAKRAEVEHLKAEGKLTAEQAMMARQKATAECRGG